jgi:signal transduction histidine kinase
MCEDDNKLLIDLGNRLVLSEERERHRLADELHDSTAQLLTAALMQLDLTAKSDSDPTPRINTARESLRSAMQEVRSMILELSSHVLFTCGLNDAVMSMAEHIEKKSGLKTKCSSDNSLINIPDDSLILLYRTVKDLLMNVDEHANATGAEFSMSCKDGVLELSVSDDGIGFDVGAVMTPSNETQGVGLFSIMKRISAMGGSVNIESEPGSGTSVCISVPVPECNTCKETN